MTLTREEALRILIVREYINMAVTQEMRRQRGAIDLWDEDRERRRRERLVESEDLYNDNRRF